LFQRRLHRFARAYGVAVAVFTALVAALHLARIVQQQAELIPLTKAAVLAVPAVVATSTGAAALAAPIALTQEEAEEGRDPFSAMVEQVAAPTVAVALLVVAEAVEAATSQTQPVAAVAQGFTALEVLALHP
jgi:cytochrome bd-type quinol oxidase subunit 2